MRPASVLGPRDWEKGFARSLALFLAGGALGSAPIAAQAGGHPHIAPRAGSFDLTTPPSKVSPMLNQADGIWNMGESPNAADVGGALGQDDPLNTTQPTFIPYPGTGGWRNLPAFPTTLMHFVGSFRKNGTFNPLDDTRASFEVVAPAVIEAGKKVVVALFTHPTFFEPDIPHSRTTTPATRATTTCSLREG